MTSFELIDACVRFQGQEYDIHEGVFCYEPSHGIESQT